MLLAFKCMSTMSSMYTKDRKLNSKLYEFTKKRISKNLSVEYTKRWKNKEFRKKVVRVF